MQNPSTSTPTNHYSGPTPADLACIPDVLKLRDQWILWRGSDRLDKDTGCVIGLDKTPYTAQGDQRASTIDPHTWTTYQRCVDALSVVLEDWENENPGAYRGGGIAYVFTADDPYCGVDLDHSVDPTTEIIAPWAQQIGAALNSYTQRSVSGTGLHVILEGKLPPGRCQDGDLQMWDHARFFAITGWYLPGTLTTIEPRQGPLEALWCAHFAPGVGDLVHCVDDAGVLANKTNDPVINATPWVIIRIEDAPDGTPYAFFAESLTGWSLSRCERVPPALANGQPLSPPLTDDKILDKASTARNGAKFTRLFMAGDTTGYTSQSEADLALCMLLAFYTQDAEQLNRLFEQSALYRAEKWGKRFDYRRKTIEKALASCSAYYQPSATLHGSSTPPGTDPAALAQQIYDDLLALPDAERTPDALFQTLSVLAALPADQWAMWKERFKAVLGRRLSLPDLNTALRALKTQAAHAHRTAHRQTQSQNDRRPLIRFDTEITRYTDEGQAALLRLPTAPIYQRAQRLAIIRRGGQAPRWLRRPPDMASIALLTPHHLRELAGQAARWEQYDEMEPHEITPPQLFVDTLMARPSWPFPVLEGIIHSPTLRPDGSVIDWPGYDQDTGLYYDPGQTIFPPIPHAPDIFDAAIALQTLKDALYDFPFEQPSDTAAALAACLTMVCRFAIRGCVPLFAVTAPVRGSGKSYLVDTMTIIGTGRPAPRWPQVVDPDEERKRLLTVALAGYPAIHIDNVAYPLGSPALDLALTATSFSDRILGQTGDVEAPLNMVWLASGNNMQYKGDTTRRVLPITIDPVTERPEERSGFRHDPLIPWVQQERPRLTIAAITVVKAFFVAGCPRQGLSSFGSFEPWSDLIRQALVWAGEADPCEGRKDIEATSNPDHETHAAVLQAWYACYKNTAVTLRQIIGDIIQRQQHVGPMTARNEWNDLFDALAACDRRFDGKTLDARRIGNEFRTWKGRLINGLRLVMGAKTRTNNVTWEVKGTPTTP